MPSNKLLGIKSMVGIMNIHSHFHLERFSSEEEKCEVLKDWVVTREWFKSNTNELSLSLGKKFLRRKIPSKRLGGDKGWLD